VALILTKLGKHTLSPLSEADRRIPTEQDIPRGTGQETVVQEYGERVNAVAAAWGMAFPDHAEIVAHQMRMSVRDPESALRMSTVGSHIRAHLVWFNPDAVAFAGAPQPL
jgi:hypothetical protein